MPVQPSYYTPSAHYVSWPNYASAHDLPFKLDLETKLCDLARTTHLFLEVYGNMEECPVCLEPLSGTVVHMECCKKMVHIQCYTVKCPMCRADLPVPIHAIQPQHIIVPVPVIYNDDRGKVVRSIIGLIGVAGIFAIITFPYYS